MSRQITVRDFAQLTKDLPPQIQAACVRGLRSAGLRGVGAVVEEIDHPGRFEDVTSVAGSAKSGTYSPVDTGAMRQSVACDPLPDGAELSVNAPQAAWIEFGTRPHMPPLGPILTWVTRKFGLGMGGKKARKPRKAGAVKAGPKAPPKAGPKEPPKHGPRLSKFHRAQRRSMRHAARQQADAENLNKAMAIANKIRWRIYHHGTPPKPFFSRAMHHVRLKIAPREIRHELKALEKRL